MSMYINESYKNLDFYKAMKPVYKNTFDFLANAYGKELNRGNNALGDSLYTLHNFNNHCINIYKIIDLFFKSSIHALCNNEDTKNIFKLYLAVLFHDYSMTKYNFNRSTHSKDSADELLKLWNFSTSELHRIRDDNIVDIDLKDINEICMIILAHSDIKDTSVAPNATGLLNPDFNNYPKTVKIMAGILRLSDELDCTESRLGNENGTDRLNLNNKNQRKSLECWEKLKCILSIGYPTDSLKTILVTLNSGYINNVSKVAQKKIFSQYIPEICNKIKKELDYVNTHVFNMPFCDKITFKADSVKVKNDECIKGLDTNLIYQFTPDILIKSKNDEKFTKRKPFDSLYVNNVSSVDLILGVDAFSNESIFWNTQNKELSLFYNYANDNEQIVEGRKDLFEDDNEQIMVKNLDNWVTSNWINNEKICICILFGYAGCGKSTFVKHLIRQQGNGRYCHFWNFYDIRKYEYVSQEESIISYLADNFFNIISDNSYKFKKNRQFISKFKSNLKFLNSICTSKFDYNLLNNYLENTSDYAHDEIINLLKLSDGTISKNVLLALTFILSASIHINNKPIIYVFDGLDIIEEPRLISNLVQNVYQILKQYNKLCKFPMIKVIFTCRKFVYSLLSSSLGEVNFIEEHPNFKSHVSTLDITSLYKINKVIRHKAKIISDNPDILNLNTYILSDKLKISECNRIVQLVDNLSDIFDSNIVTEETLSLSKMVNHNLRSAAALFHVLSNSNNIDTYFISKPKTDYQRICYKGFFVFALCSELNRKGVWKNMGYCTNDSETFPTTLSRMILTLLARHGEELSLSEIYNVFKWIPFSVISKDEDINNIAIDNDLSIEVFADCMADMLNRNATPDDAISSEGIWRRPLYFGSCAISPSSQYDKKNMYKNEFVSLLENNSYIVPNFKISECGEEFVDTIAIHFEFNAVRNSCSKKTLWMYTNSSSVIKILKDVFSAVDRCMKKQIWLANKYLMINNKDYFSEEFHPITKWLKRPQLHIIRVVFSHIAYLDAIRTYFWKGDNCNADKKDIINALNDGIGNYLNLLKENLPNLKVNVEQDTKIYETLNSLYQYVINNKTNSDPYIISINNREIGEINPL